MPILKDAAAAAAALHEYDTNCVHYNLVAEGVYCARARFPTLSDDRYLPYIVAGLIGFDIGRMMGRNDTRYTKFAGQLQRHLSPVATSLEAISGSSLDTCKLESVSGPIKAAYRSFCGLGPKGKKFHVGATKILHWIAPELFIMLDRNVARAFYRTHGIPFKDSTQPGYSADLYLDCLKLAQKEIQKFDPAKLRELAPETPIARIFDKVAFIVGKP